MAAATLSTFIRELSRAMAAEALSDQSDRELVEQFLAAHSEPVFVALVRRHGPMVYRVCWRVLHQEQDAEDAFQATFLVLAKNLQSVRKRESLASWLHGVAHRVALKAKVQVALRRRHEQQAPAARAEALDSLTCGEIWSVLDGELVKLPEKWRQPLVLCYLEGRTQDEAAGQLGWSKNTLRRRLEEARAILGQRLSRRGVTLPAALAALLLSDSIASAALPSAMVVSTAAGAARVAAGETVASAVSGTVAALINGAWTTTAKIKLGILLLAGLIGTAVAISAQYANLPEPPPAQEKGMTRMQVKAPKEDSKADKEKQRRTKMSIKGSKVWLASMVCSMLIALPGCVESERPLSDAKKAKVDNRLCGVWTNSEGSKTTVLVCGRSQIKGHPAGMMRFEWIEMDNVNQTFLSLPQYFFISDVGDHSFLNLLSIFGRMKPLVGEEPPIDFGIEGDYQAFLGSPGTKYGFLRYQIGRDRESKQDTLTLWEPDEDLAKKAIQRGAINGTFGTKANASDVIFTDSSENLTRFFKSDLGKEMFSSGRRQILSRVK